MCKLFFTFLMLLVFSSNYGQEAAVENETPTIGLNSYLTYQMMEPNQNLRKLEILFDAKSEGDIPLKSLNFGFSMIGIADYQRTNTASKFAYLMRHPTSNNQLGESASEVVLHSAQVSFVASLNSWISSYGELLYSPEQSFGPGTITAIGRNQIELRKGIILFGNNDKFPLYLGLGKMDIPFGQTHSYSPFSSSSMWHAYGVLSYGAVLGIKTNGLHISLSAIQGGAQFRAANVPVDSTNVPSRVNNFAADINYTIASENNFSLKVGASYLKGSAYNQAFPITHFSAGTDYNPATAIYGEITIMERLFLKGSFAITQDVWPGTFNPNPPLNEFPASKVSSLDYGAKYQINTTGNVLFSLSGEFSDFNAGADGSPWERQSQIIVGLNAQVEQTSRLFLEVFRTNGYVPLNFISGGNFDDLGETHSDRDATSMGVVLGVLFSI